MLFKVCNSLMSSNFNMLAVTSSGQDEAQKFQNTAEPILSALITSFCAIVGAVATIWAIWCAFGFFSAKDGSAREDAKKKLVYSIVACIVTVILIVILVFVKKNLRNWLGSGDIFQQQ